MIKTNSIKYLLFTVLIFGACFADFQTKKWAESYLKGKPTLSVLPGLLELGYVENRGMIFGILNKKMPQAGKTALVVLRIMILVMLSVFMWKYRTRSYHFHLPLIIIWAGALGNLIDPFIYGYVVDFIHIKLYTFLDWPFFFNLADAYVTVGIALLLAFSFFFKSEFSDF